MRLSAGRVVWFLSAICGMTGCDSGEKMLIAHRGASAYAPEHTLAAYRLAVEQGADYVEQDLQITKDGVLVCLHDRTLQRTTDVEQVFPERFRPVQRDGRQEKDWLVCDFTLSEVKRLDAGSWFGPRFTGERVPTWREVIFEIRGKAGLFPELKDPEFYAERGLDMVRLVVQELRSHGLADAAADSRTAVTLQSFDGNSLRRLRFEYALRLPLVFLIGRAGRPWVHADRLSQVAEFASGIGPDKSLVEEDPKLVGRAHSLGLTVTPYTFRAGNIGQRFEDATAEMSHYLFELGVDGLFTDNPDLFPRN